MRVNKIEEIENRVSVRDVLQKYWSQPDRNGRYKCVAHNGKDYNMSIEKGFAYCFVCNRNMGSLTIAKEIFGLTTAEAIKKIDEDFGLGLGKPLTPQEKKKYAEQQRKKERERKRQEEMAKFESECLAIIAEKLRIADDYIREKSFKGEVGSEEMYHYTDTLDYKMFMKAIDRKRWLEWLWCVITGDSYYLVDEEYCATYGTDKVVILRKVYKGEIEI